MVRLWHGLYLSTLFSFSDAVDVGIDEYYHTQLLQVKAKAERVAKVSSQHSNSKLVATVKGLMHNSKSMVAKQKFRHQMEQKHARVKHMKEKFEKQHSSTSGSKLSKASATLAELPFCEEYGNLAQTCLLCSALCVEQAKSFGCTSAEDCADSGPFHECVDQCTNLPNKIIDNWCEGSWYFGRDDFEHICHECGQECLSDCNEDLLSCQWGFDNCQYRCTDKHMMARDPYMIEWCEFNWGEGVDGFQCLDCEWGCSDEVYSRDTYDWEESHMEWIRCSQDCLGRPNVGYQMCQEKFGEDVNFIQCDSCLWSCDCREYPGSEDYNLTCDESCAADCMGLGHGMQGEHECMKVYGPNVDVEHCVGCADGCMSADPEQWKLSPDEWFNALFQCMDECVGLKNHAIEQCECQDVDMLTCFQCSMECCADFQGCSEDPMGSDCLDECHARQAGSDSWSLLQQLPASSFNTSSSDMSSASSSSSNNSSFTTSSDASSSDGSSSDDSSSSTDSTDLIQVKKHLK